MANSNGRDKITDKVKDNSLHSKLAFYINLLEKSDINFNQEISKFRAIDERLTNQRFHLAVLGQFKRGKSTFVNSLIGKQLLPSSVLPLTSIPTYIQFGKQQHAEISFQNKKKEIFESTESEQIRKFLAKYVTESANPRNRLNVSSVNIFSPMKLFADGMVIIDTPGIGSTHKHNTEATINFLPQCDAAIFVVSVDPPITTVEIDFLKEIKQTVPKIFFVLNKIDYLSPTDLELSIDFLRKTVSEQAGIDEKIYPVSALKAIEALEHKNDRRLSESGVPILKKELGEFFRNKKMELLTNAMLIRADNIIKTVKMKINLAIKANQMPVKELDNRLKLFNEKLSEIETEKIVAGDLINGDKKRLSQQLEQQTEQLRIAIKKELMDKAKEQFASDSGKINYNDIYKVVADTIPALFEHKYGELFNDFDKKIENSLNRHNQRLRELTQAIWKAASNVFDINFYSFSTKDKISRRYKPYWTTHRWDSGFMPDTEGIFDRFLPKAIQKRNMLKRIETHIETLVMRNAENLRFSILQNINRLFASFTQSFELNITETISDIKQIIAKTAEKYKNNTQTASEAVTKLELLLQKIEQNT